jgi:hypothetical protein
MAMKSSQKRIAMSSAASDRLLKVEASSVSKPVSADV